MTEQRTTGVTVNPAARKSQYLGRDSKFDVAVTPAQVYSAVEVRHLLTEAAAELDAGTMRREDAAAVALPFLTGMREAEVFGLQWPDLDPVGGVVNIWRTAFYIKGGLVVDTTKNRAPLHTIDASPEVFAMLQAIKAERDTEALLATGRPPASAWVFPDPEDATRPMNGQDFYTRIWTPLLRRAGLKHIRYHEARHTFATVALARGARLEWISRQLDHCHVGFTDRVYVHWKAGRDPRDIGLLAGAFFAGVRTKW